MAKPRRTDHLPLQQPDQSRRLPRGGDAIVRGKVDPAWRERRRSASFLSAVGAKGEITSASDRYRSSSVFVAPFIAVARPVFCPTSIFYGTAWSKTVLATEVNGATETARQRKPRKPQQKQTSLENREFLAYCSSADLCGQCFVDGEAKQA